MNINLEKSRFIKCAPNPDILHVLGIFKKTFNPKLELISYLLAPVSPLSIREGDYLELVDTSPSIVFPESNLVYLETKRPAMHALVREKFKVEVRPPQDFRSNLHIPDADLALIYDQPVRISESFKKGGFILSNRAFVWSNLFQKGFAQVAAIHLDKIKAGREPQIDFYQGRRFSLSEFNVEFRNATGNKILVFQKTD